MIKMFAIHILSIPGYSILYYASTLTQSMKAPTPAATNRAPRSTRDPAPLSLTTWLRPVWTDPVVLELVVLVEAVVTKNPAVEVVVSKLSLDVGRGVA